MPFRSRNAAERNDERITRQLPFLQVNGTLTLMELTRDQIKMLATLSANMAQVSIASIVIPYFLDTFDILLASLGLTGALFFSAASVYLLKSPR